MKGILSCGADSARRLHFVTWVSDHAPRHVHVYRDGRLAVKWDLENRVAMKGKATRRILDLIEELQRDGEL